MPLICRVIATQQFLGSQLPDPALGILIARALQEYPNLVEEDLEEVQVSQEEYEAIINPVIPPTLAQAKATKLNEIWAKADTAMLPVTAYFSPAELLSWPKQEAEAKALLVDPQADAPLLTSISLNRGIPLLTLRDKVLANVAFYENLSGFVIGRQQYWEDILTAATTVEQVQAIVVSYSP